MSEPALELLLFPLRAARHPAADAIELESADDFIRRAEGLPPFTWLMDQLIPSAGSVMLVSPPNCGKTWLSLVAAKTAACAGRQVLLVEEEGSAKGLAERFKNLALPPGLPMQIAHRKGVLVDDEAMFEGLCWMAENWAEPVFIMDPLVSLSRGDENSTEDAAALIRQLATLHRLNSRLLLILLHHSSKVGAGGEGHAIYAARGSSVFSGWCDTQLNLSKPDKPAEPGTVRFGIEVAKQREATLAVNQLAVIDLGTGEVSIGPASDEKKVDRRQAIVDHLWLQGEALTRNQIFAAVKGHRPAVLRLVNEMLEDGELAADDKNRLRPGPKAGPLSKEGSAVKSGPYKTGTRYRYQGNGTSWYRDAAEAKKHEQE